MKCLAGWITSRNQDCQENYQEPHICRWYHSSDRKQRGTKEPLDEGKEESEKPGLKLNIKKAKIIASCPITSWQIEEENVEAVTNFLFLGSKLTEDGDCCHDIRRWLLLGKKAMRNLESIVLRSKDIALKRNIVKSMVFPIVMYR